MELNDVVMKLIGPVNPVGETRTDEERFENLKRLIALVDELTDEIEGVATSNRRSHEYSRKRAADLCDKFLGV